MEDDINKAIATLEKAVQFYINNNDDALECSSLYGSFTMVKLATLRKKSIAPAYNKGAYQYITLNDTKTIGR
jgi:hypothetical protein